MIQHRAIQPADFALDLRSADEAECLAGGFTPALAIEMSQKQSHVSYAVEADGEVVAFWGWGSSTLLSNVAYGWLLTRPPIENHKFRFIRSSQRIVEYILSLHTTLIVLVDKEHREAIKWLDWLGFEYDSVSPFNRLIYMRKDR